MSIGLAVSSFTFFLAFCPLCIYGISYWLKSRQQPSTGKEYIPTFSKKNFAILSYGMKEDPKTKKFFIGMLVVGLLACMALSFFKPEGIVVNVLTGIVGSLVLYITTINLAKKGFEKKQSTIDTLLEIKKKTIGAVDNSSNVWTYRAEYPDIAIENDIVQSITARLPAGFDSATQTKFLSRVGETVGEGGYYVVDDDGWDIKKRKVVLKRKEFASNEEMTFVKDFIQFKKKNLGLVDQQSTMYTFYNELEILEPDEDKKPLKMKLMLPVGADPSGSVKFLDTMSTQFGRGRPWEVDGEAGGWDVDEKIAFISLEAPLPQLATWDEKYLEHKDVQWSFFPLGIASKWGIPVEDGEGNVEHLVGFDVNGAQQKYMSKNNIQNFPDLMPSPHAILAGVTGGGKCLKIDSKVLVYEAVEDPEND